MFSNTGFVNPQELKRKTLEAFYDHSMSQNLEDILNLSPVEIYKATAKVFQTHGAELPEIIRNASAVQWGKSYKFLHKVANACSNKDDFYVAVTENDLPPVKLTAEEMEFTRGGGTSEFISGGMALFGALSSEANPFDSLKI